MSRPRIGFPEYVAVARVLRSGILSQGVEGENFEQEFSISVVEGLTAVAVNSGTSALHLGLIALGIGPGDEVIVPSFTFAATANAVVLSGAKPVFCDISPETFAIDPAHMEALINDRTAGVIAVHLFGHPADMVEICRIATRKGIAVIEDAAQAHGAEIEGRKVGTFGAFSMFSLYPSKNITTGEGGVLVSANADLCRVVRLLRNQGMEQRYRNEIVGYNNRLPEISAALGRAQLRRLSRLQAQRRKNSAYLRKRLEGVVPPVEIDGYTHVYNQFTVRLPTDRDRIAQALLTEFDIQTGVYYPLPLHELPSLSGFAPGLELEETSRAVKEVLSLPVHPGLRRRELEKIADAVNHLVGA